jgi:hypothetical protein
VAFSQNTYADTGVGGSQEIQPPVHNERYGLPEIGVYISRLEDRNMRLSPQGRGGLAPRLQRRSRRLKRAMVEVSRSGAVRIMISRHKIQQNTARIDRTARNVVFCRTFLRAILYPAIARRW